MTKRLAIQEPSAFASGVFAVFGLVASSMGDLGDGRDEVDAAEHDTTIEHVMAWTALSPGLAIGVLSGRALEAVFELRVPRLRVSP